MNTLPLFFNLSDKAVLIIGGGEVAHRKAALLVQVGVSIVLIARNIKSELFDLLKDSQDTLIQKDYESSDLTQSFAFVIVATNDNLLNERIYHDAHAQHLFVNVVDTPHLCDFIFPAIIDRSPVVIGVSSNGKAPVFGKTDSRQNRKHHSPIGRQNCQACRGASQAHQRASTQHHSKTQILGEGVYAHFG